MLLYIKFINYYVIIYIKNFLFMIEVDIKLGCNIYEVNKKKRTHQVHGAWKYNMWVRITSEGECHTRGGCIFSKTIWPHI